MLFRWSGFVCYEYGNGTTFIDYRHRAGKYMPKPGGWMDTIKSIFGVVMLALAIWTLSRVVPPMIIMLLWTILTISSSVYMGL